MLLGLATKSRSSSLTFDFKVKLNTFYYLCNCFLSMKPRSIIFIPIFPTPPRLLCPFLLLPACPPLLSIPSPIHSPSPTSPSLLSPIFLQSLPLPAIPSHPLPIASHYVSSDQSSPSRSSPSPLRSISIHNSISPYRFFPDARPSPVRSIPSISCTYPVSAHPVSNPIQRPATIFVFFQIAKNFLLQPELSRLIIFIQCLISDSLAN